MYITMGDGGIINNMASANGQDLTNLLGSIMRIDVDNPGDGLNYGIPPDNPFAGNLSGFREEIFAYGFRNPWRMSIDPITGTIWAGDVGDLRREEVDIVENGNNYGWKIMEGNNCFDPPSNCNMTGLTLPVHDYPHSDLNRAVIGGEVYRGAVLTELVGLYIYGDFASGRIWAIDYDGDKVVDNTQLLQFDELKIVSFGVDEVREIYACSFDGHIYRLARDN